ncbi:MAG: aminoacyl-tRNA hydrolase [Rubrobacter sp.]|jgi:PTH1 family peptidyl-tRNA hydrolase|nr:aminoacyl-tRNA hydrolase [Rubrobacteraceae bacterium]MBA3615605.1 aminoacyl-tRNA hydrolase [Rubrobacteraceae bacterium]MDQ3251223.1 aminoacyl-tRNA hydrolase [Actinomycetota bacterium]MDQ3436509.1 aminoacyl-tRNA hydrolase [Actinomycetota bacterium]
MLPRRAPQDKTSRLRLVRYFFKRDERDEGGAIRPPFVVGLGNPGRSYERTRHNAGYLVADELARRHDGSWRKRKKAEAAPVSVGPTNTTLLKPTTFMNNTGSAVSDYRPEDLIVVHDDLDLEAGTVRVKVGGGAGGHNGLRSIIGRLGNDFIRVRIGIGRPPLGMSVTDYVLSRMDPVVKDAIPRAADAVEFIFEHGPEAAMNRFNVRA